MPSMLRQHALHIAFMAVVFLLFTATAVGIVEFSIPKGGGIRVHTLLFGPAGGGLSVPAVIRTGEFLLLVAIGLGLCVALPLLSPIRASLVTAAAAIPFLVLGLSVGGSRSLLPMEFNLLTVLVIYALNVLVSYFRETRDKQKIIGVFGQYVPPHVVEEISRHPDQISMEGESRRMTVFFCDLQNFSGVAEQLNPRQLTLLLNEYFTGMTEVLYRYGATIDKYIGDSIMAFWGAPLPQEDHAGRAVLAAFDMHRAIKELSASFVRRGWPGPTMGIGINTGMMNVGNMGSRYRVAYTVVGDAVNLASRLESLTRVYHVPTIVSEFTKEDCADILFRSLDVVQVRGKHNRTRIHQPMCRKEDAGPVLIERLSVHEQAMEHYFAERWDDATAMFRELQDGDRADPFYPAALKRIEKITRN